MKILLTGSSGFIGRNFFKQYVGKYEFRCLVIKEDADDIRKHCHDPTIDAVVHLGAYAGVRRSHQIPEEFYSMNVDGTSRIFSEYARDYYAPIPIVWASSSSVYEWWLSPYATTKKICEEISRYTPNTLGLRFHTVYGEDSRPDMLYDRLNKRDVEYVTNHTRDWTHVEDVCSAIDLCLENFNDMRHYKFIDVGNGRPCTVKELADHLWPDNNLPVREVTGEREHTCADPKILLKYGWKPKHNVLEN
jgi:nucleoside-diphosphate-sugar epimerase